MRASEPRARRRFLQQSLIVFSVLTVLVLWRYAFSPSTTVSDPGDPILLMWIMDWVSRALVSAPLELFDAPMFHPFSDTLAYSDPLLPQALVTLPLRALGLGPVLAYNAVFCGGIVVAGVLTSLLFRELCGDERAALIGAVVATFPVLRLFHLAHMQLQITTFWPLALLLVHRLVKRPDAKAAVLLSLTLAAAALASLYHGMFMALLLPPFTLGVWLLARRRSAASPVLLVAAAAGAGLLLWPFARVYSRALAHLAQPRDPGWSDVAHYFAISPFSDLGELLPFLVVQQQSPQWIGAGAAMLLPVSLLAAGAVAIRRLMRRRLPLRPFPDWARACLPYTVLGCLAIGLSLGPELRWSGQAFAPNPLAAVARLPGVREIRDFQRLAFVAALAGGALVAIALAELARQRRPRLVLAAQTLALLTTLAPIVSSSLPAHRPPSVAALAPVYRWLQEQPERIVLFEIPLPRHDQPLDYLWASIHHEKPLIHGFSGYLPWTDLALRGESLGAHRPDLWRTLAGLGATHVVVHTARLAAMPAGAAALTSLREARSGDRIASFSDAEVYRVSQQPTPAPSVAELRRELVTASAGGTLDGRCVEVGPGVPPLVLYVPRSRNIAALAFVAETPIGDIDDALLVELSASLGAFRPAEHQPLLSTSIAEYVRRPTPLLWTHAVLAPADGPFVRLSSRRDRRLRLCEIGVMAPAASAVEIVRFSRDGLRLGAHAAASTAALASDGDPHTRWHSQAPQAGSEWLEVDLGELRLVQAVVLDLGQTAYDYGRRLALDCPASAAAEHSGFELDGRDALFDRPRPVQILWLPQARRCRSLRIRQTGQASSNHWSVAELEVYGHGGS